MWRFDDIPEWNPSWETLWLEAERIVRIHEGATLHLVSPWEWEWDENDWKTPEASETPEVISWASHQHEMSHSEWANWYCQALLFSFIWFFHFLFHEFLFFFILFSESSRRISESCMQSLCIIVGNLSVYCQYESFHTFVFLRLSEFKLEFPIIGFLCSVLPRRSLTAHRNAYMIHP